MGLVAGLEVGLVAAAVAWEAHRRSLDDRSLAEWPSLERSQVKTHWTQARVRSRVLIVARARVVVLVSGAAPTCRR